MIDANYEFFGCQVTEDRPQVSEISVYSTCEGYVEIITPGITADSTLEAEVYKLIVPTYTEPKYIRAGANLYTEAVLYVSRETLSNGNLRIFYRFDPYQIAGSTHGDYYGVTFFINRAGDASVVKVAKDIVIHIINQFKEAEV